MTDWIAAIRATPDDDGPRLVYADWLTEQGDPRGEFIQLQCRGLDPPRQRELIKLHHSEWMNGIPWVYPHRFERGFIASLEMWTLGEHFRFWEAIADLPIAPEVTRSSTDATALHTPDGRLAVELVIIDPNDPMPKMRPVTSKLAVYDVGTRRAVLEREDVSGFMDDGAGYLVSIRLEGDRIIGTYSGGSELVIRLP